MGSNHEYRYCMYSMNITSCHIQAAHSLSDSMCMVCRLIMCLLYPSDQFIRPQIHCDRSQQSFKLGAVTNGNATPGELSSSRDNLPYISRQLPTPSTQETIDGGSSLPICNLSIVVHEQIEEMAKNERSSFGDMDACSFLKASLEVMVYGHCASHAFGLPQQSAVVARFLLEASAL